MAIRYNTASTAKQAANIPDEALCVDSTVEIVVQLCGKIKARINVPTAADKDELLKMAKEAIAQSLEGKTIRKEIVVPGKLVNIVAN